MEEEKIITPEEANKFEAEVLELTEKEESTDE